MSVRRYLRDVTHALRSLRRTDWAVIVTITLVAALITVLGVVAWDAARARQDDVARAKAAAAVALDLRRAQTRRIDLLQQRIDELTEELAWQARRSGRQEQAIADLAEQVRQLGGQPVTTGEPSRRPPAAGRPAASTDGAAPRPQHTSTPAPGTSWPAQPPDNHLVCLPVLGCI